jgi:hypothetical protein
LPIDPLTEDLIWPTEAAKLYPRGPGGKTVHVGRVYRDMKRGLESIRTPRMATSRQAVARFFRRLSEVSRPTEPANHNNVARVRATQEVEQALDRLGF